MTPRTRSSLSSLPATPSARSVNTSTSTTPKTTPRRVPRCTKCGNPRAGHPRSGCPNVPESPSSSPAPFRAKQEPPDLTNALSDLHIRVASEADDDKALLRARRVKNIPTAPEASLASLSSTSSNVINRLLKPGIMNDDIMDEGDQESINQWRETVATPTKANDDSGSRVRQRMPCTLYTPNPSFFSSPAESVIGSEDTIKHSSQDTSASIPSALSRTWSTEERTTFLNKLVSVSPTPPATVYRFYLSDIYSFEIDAIKLGFHSRVIEDNDGIFGSLVLGRNKDVVEDICYGVRRGTISVEPASKSGSGKGAAFAGGAVVGAVATFTGLAFS